MGKINYCTMRDTKLSRRSLIKSTGLSLGGALTSGVVAGGSKGNTKEPTSKKETIKKAHEINFNSGTDAAERYLESNGFRAKFKKVTVDLGLGDKNSGVGTQDIENPEGDGITFSISGTYDVNGEFYKVSLSWWYHFHAKAQCPTFGTCKIATYEDGSLAPNTHYSSGEGPKDAVAFYLQGNEGVSWELKSSNYYNDTFKGDYTEASATESNAQSGQIGFLVDDAAAYKDWGQQFAWDGGTLSNYGGEHESDFDGGMAGVDIVKGDPDIESDLRQVTMRYVHTWGEYSYDIGIGYGSPASFNTVVTPEYEVQQVPVDNFSNGNLLDISESEMGSY